MGSQKVSLPIWGVGRLHNQRKNCPNSNHGKALIGVWALEGASGAELFWGVWGTFLGSLEGFPLWSAVMS